VSNSFRFGVSLHKRCSRKEWVAKCRKAESLGFDVLLVADHLHMPAPFPSLVLAAEATEAAKVGTFVLNSGFWNPRLLAREVATVQALTDGRLEVGLGAGYVEAEYHEAGLTFPRPGQRVDRLARNIRSLLGPDAQPVQESGLTRARLLIAGRKDRVLALAARHGDLVGMSALEQVPGQPEGTMRAMTAAAMRERVAYFRQQAGERLGDIEVNAMIQHVVPTRDRRAAAGMLATHAPHLTPEEILEAPAGLVGTSAQMADILRERREAYGVSYITIHEGFMDALAPVISLLKTA
jgi:probable F420-dependent oxidoreductase